MQRVYGFAICLGVGLLFGFLVSHLLQDCNISCLHTLTANLIIFAVKCFLLDASEVCDSIYICKHSVYRKVGQVSILCHA